MNVVEIIIALILSVYSILSVQNWKDSKPIKKIFTIIAIISVCVIAYNNYNSWREERLLKKIQAKYGDISDIDITSLPQVQIGYTGATFTGLDGTFSIGLLGPVLKYNVKNNKLIVTTIIRGLSGKLIAVIIDNEWQWVSESNSYDYNYDDNAFEVVTLDRNVCFQIELKNGVVHISGFFFNEEGSGYCIAVKGNTTTSFITPINKDYFAHLPPSNIPLLFKYPRERYLGKRSN